MAQGVRTIVFVRLGFAFVVVGLAASAFLLATLQAAYSPLALALPSGPFEQLAGEAFRFAVASFVFASLASTFGVERDLSGLARLYSVGAFSKLALLAFAAANGMMAIQATDPRALAPRLFIARVIANLVVLASLGWAAALLLRQRDVRESSE